jgi:amidase
MLKKVGHNIIEGTPCKHDYAYNLISRIYVADGGADILTTLKESGEPPIPNIADLASPSLHKLDIN